MMTSSKISNCLQITNLLDYLLEKIFPEHP